MSKVNQLRRLMGEARGINAEIANLKRKIDRKREHLEQVWSQAHGIGGFLVCDDCRQEHFVATGEGLPRSWWFVRDDDEGHETYKCPECMHKHTEGAPADWSAEEEGWRRCGKSRRQKRREKFQRSRKYWEAEIAFLDEKEWKLYRGTRLQMAGMIYGSGLPGYGGFGSEVNLGRCQKDGNRYQVGGSWYHLTAAPEVWKATGERLLQRNGVTLD